MKFAVAALLAIAATAVQIKQEDGDLPFPAPKCPPKPDMEGATDAEIFAAVDADESGEVDAQEGFNALYCMVEWGEMSRDEAEWLWHYLGEAAGEDELLSMEEAQAAMDALEEGDDEGCGPEPDMEGVSPEDVFDHIDADGNGGIDEHEGMAALGCAVEWGWMTQDEAVEAFEYLGSHAGEDGLLDKEEAKAAMEALGDEELAQEGCGPKPSKEEMDAASPEDVFDAIDADGSGDIDEAEGKAALTCAVEWELISEDEAKAAFEYLAGAAGDDGLLDKDEAKAAMEALPAELAQKEGCGPKPSEEEMDAATPEDVFDAIDADGSGDIDAEEGEAALRCAVEWELISEDEAVAAFEYLAGAAGDDGLLDKDEAKAAMEALEE